jgi:preprotein translocase subunit SecE
MARVDANKKSVGDRLKGFFRGVWSELKKVHWPDRRQLITYTGVVVIFVLVMSLAISALDWVFSNLIKLALH